MVKTTNNLQISQSRKARRKEARAAKKQAKRKHHAITSTPEPPHAGQTVKKKKSEPTQPKTTMSSKKEKKKSKQQQDDPYAHLDPDVAAAMRRDDQEIAELEAKLGLQDEKQKKRLNREYAKLEGYGDDFGSFLLNDLDFMMKRVVTADADYDGRTGERVYDDDEEEEDEEQRIMDSSDDDDDDNDEEEEEEELIPMKSPAYDDLDEDDSVMEELEAAERGGDKDDDNTDESSGDDDDDDDDEELEDDMNEKEAPDDHDSRFIYRPSKGEDIYGNKLETSDSAVEPKKYVPPHLRGKSRARQGNNDNKDNEQSHQEIQRSLNKALNRLSEDTLVPVSQSIAQLYPLHPSAIVNECIWKNTRNACIARPLTMAGLIPTYVAALAGVHIQKGDSAQLGEYLIEMTVVALWEELKVARQVGMSGESPNVLEEEPSVSKEACNLVLVLCYLYNFGVVHCSLLYDLIRNLISHFAEVDVELLLLILSHCGRALRMDDPSSLKEIVLLVQKRMLEIKNTVTYSSRVDYMVSAMTDLKNNKRRKQDIVYAEKTSKLRKQLGQIKSIVSAGSNSVRSSDASQRLTLEDVLNAETRGRWWKVGASWVGNQYKYHNGDQGAADSYESSNAGAVQQGRAVANEEDEKLLKLAAKYRMNTDIRRSIFCIIMGSADCDDAFEKLVRAGMLKNRTERETVRVLMECCGNEKSYNKFYSHLASRICDYQPQCKFTFQLAFWDIFKQFKELKVRRAANLAKLLFHLVAVHHALKLNVLKAIDMSSPDELPETAMIFLTIFLSNILEHFDDPSGVSKLFETGITHRRAKNSSLDEETDDMGHIDDVEALRANLTVFFMQILKASPKYKKGSKFRTNLKAAVKACDTDSMFLD